MWLFFFIFVFSSNFLVSVLILVLNLKHEINCLKIENTRLLNFPPLKPDEVPHDQLSQRDVSFTLLIGAHVLTGPTPQVIIL